MLLTIFLFCAPSTTTTTTSTPPTQCTQEDRDVAGDSLTPEGEAAYWALRYTIRRGVTEDFDVPVFLGSSVDAILVTGECCWGWGRVLGWGVGGGG